MRATKPDLRRQGSSRARRAPAGRDCKRSRALALLDTRHQAALLLDLAPRQFVLLVLERVVASLETHQQRHALEFELCAEQIGRATSELQSLMRISYAVFCLKKNKRHHTLI